MSAAPKLTPASRDRLATAWAKVLRERRGGRWQVSVADDNLDPLRCRRPALSDDHAVDPGLQDAA